MQPTTSSSTSTSATSRVDVIDPIARARLLVYDPKNHELVRHGGLCMDGDEDDVQDEFTAVAIAIPPLPSSVRRRNLVLPQKVLDALVDREADRGTVVSWGSRYTKRVWMATAAAVLPLSALPTVLQRLLDDGDEFLVLDSVDRIKDTRHGHQKANGSIFADLCNGLYNSEQFSVDIFVIRQMID
ncbi:uncharacterized protein EHS24_003044 [Apiotrichum porosum]|uniref:Uncharacterized protein n=1 Tax=Apiotrichum porosum TaxID=105984 RepID=A0A427XGF0_9TREE|nr:uncharacterized protein EHS24_003044 [Apiotrichum porosum]RSH77970.1 hypothetical protein EHS24_003044 [Apiotrichum porosum]